MKMDLVGMNFKVGAGDHSMGISVDSRNRGEKYLYFRTVGGYENFGNTNHLHEIVDLDGINHLAPVIIRFDNGDMFTFIKLSEQALYVLATEFGQFYTKVLMDEIHKEQNPVKGETQMLRMNLNSLKTEKIVENLISTNILRGDVDFAVSHLRKRVNVNGEKSVITQVDAREGGTTVVTINFKDVGLMTGRANCSDRDNYSRIGGRTIAIQRALDARTRKLNKDS